MVSIKSPQQIQKMREAGKILYDALQETILHAKPGITTKELDAIAENYILKHGGTPGFKNYQGFPATLCTSLNDSVVHGIPNALQVCKEGDILSIDCGVIYDGLYADSAITVGIGQISPQAQKLIDTTEKAFFEGAKKAVAGLRLGDIGNAVFQVANKQHFGVVRVLSGHGIGTNLHEDPSILNFGTPGKGARLYKNMTICIEPMITSGSEDVYLLDDDWTIKTVDGSLCSHYEHTLLIKDGLPELITYPGFEWKEDA